MQNQPANRLCVHPDFPYLGASPDGVVECDCCGRGVIEIKCPFSCRERSFSKASEDSPSFCLGTNEDGQFQLKKNHAYYYQVQLQMKLCDLNYADFIIWRFNVFWGSAAQSKIILYSMVFFLSYWLDGIQRNLQQTTPMLLEMLTISWLFLLQKINIVILFAVMDKTGRMSKRKWFCPDCRKMPSTKWTVILTFWLCIIMEDWMNVNV